MQIKKAGAVAVGALATVAAMGAPASAATHSQNPGYDKSQAMRAMGAQFLGPSRGGWDAPWDQQHQSLVSVGSGSAVSALAWQPCGSTVGLGVGAVGLSISSPNTVVGDCANANIKLSQDTVPGVVSVLSDTAVSVASWQFCGATSGGGVIAVGAALQSPNTVLGGCDNSNIIITRDHDYDNSYNNYNNGYHQESTTVAEAANAVALRRGHLAGDTAMATPVRNGWTGQQQQQGTRGGWKAPWDTEPTSFLSIGSGSAVQALSWQFCGSTAGAGVLVGAALSISSPNTVLDDCNNANVWIDQDDPTALLSVLDNTSINIAPWQSCGSTIGGGIGAIGAALQSPNTVFGNCNNANVTID